MRLCLTHACAGPAARRLLGKASEGTYLYNRELPARDESFQGYNAEAVSGARPNLCSSPAPS